jgi:Domain of unknown function (DUF4861)
MQSIAHKRVNFTLYHFKQMYNLRCTVPAGRHARYDLLRGIFSLFAILLIVALAGCRPSGRPVASEVISVEVTNPLNESRENALVEISVFQLQASNPEFNPKAFYIIDREAEIASEFVPAKPDAPGNIIYVVLEEMSANETRTFTIYYNKEGALERTYKKRTYAELSPKKGGTWKDRVYEGGDYVSVDFLRVPPQHKDHSYFIRYEGPGWESDKVGYRFYLDQRNATDVFGKKTDEMVLMEVGKGAGKENFDSYHEMQPWGMDVMKVGKSLGLGSPAYWKDTTAVRFEKTDSVTCRIETNGTLVSRIKTNYYGWQTRSDTFDVESTLSIHAGTRWTHSEVLLLGAPENFATGIVKDKSAKFFKSEGTDSTFGYMATWGKQSLNSDNLGLAVVFRRRDFRGFTADYYSNVVTLNPFDNRVDYWFAAAWELEKDGIKTEEEFIKYVEKSARELANPVIVSIK